MKKILFRKLILDCLIFFSVSIISTGVIIWVFQAVNFLEIIVEDGRDFLVYFSYSLLNFPKIISKLIPFISFFSFYYILQKYETSNELIIFWNFGVRKIEIINLVFKFSFFLLFLQLFLNIFIVPETQSYSRSLLKNSSIDFFESFIKPKKFNDNIKGLTIYAEEKDANGNLKNIYLKKDQSDSRFKYQITLAKYGKFETISNSKVLVLYDGNTLNSINNKITNINFSKSEFGLSNLESDIIVTEKIQETSTLDHIDCLKIYFTKNLKINSKAPEYSEGNCQKKNLENIVKEIYKRFLIPLYLPLLLLITTFLILKSKENKHYKKYKINIFVIGILIIIISESSLKFIQPNFYGNIKFILLPIILIFFSYIYLISKLRIKK